MLIDYHIAVDPNLLLFHNKVLPLVTIKTTSSEPIGGYNCKDMVGQFATMKTRLTLPASLAIYVDSTQPLYMTQGVDCCLVKYWSETIINLHLALNTDSYTVFDKKLYGIATIDKTY